MNARRLKWLVALMVPALLLLSPVAMAEEEKKLGWSDTAEASLVATGGNSESFTVGAKNVLTRTWEKANLTFTLGLIRAETNDFDRYAVEGSGPGNGYDVIKKDNKDTDPERYYFTGRYNRLITKEFFWYTSLDWERNRPSALENRTTASGGVGNIWFDTKKTKWYTDYAATYTDEEDTDGESTSYGGLRLGSNLTLKINDSTTYINVIILDENLDETSDFRADILNEIQVSMSTHLALKVGLRAQFDNEPSFEDIDLFDIPPGQGGMSLRSITAQKDSWDTTFTGSLVVNF